MEFDTTVRRTLSIFNIFIALHSLGFSLATIRLHFRKSTTVRLHKTQTTLNSVCYCWCNYLLQLVAISMSFTKDFPGNSGFGASSKNSWNGNSLLIVSTVCKNLLGQCIDSYANFAH